MDIQDQIPSGALAPFVECYWSVRVPPELTASRPDRIVPNGTINLIFNLSGYEHRQYQGDNLSAWMPLRERWISGIRDACICVGPTHCTHVVGIRFKPGGLAPFLRMPISEVSHRTLALDELWGREIRFLHERLYEVTGVAQRFALLESWLSQQVGGGPSPDPRMRFCLSELERGDGLVSVSRLSKQVDLSPKQLRRHFDREVGLTPKRLARLIRFQAVIRGLDGIESAVDWALVAARFGYYDQSHMIADFHDFTGLTPNDYQRKKSPVLNFIPVDS